jgi:hypothetical protein
MKLLFIARHAAYLRNFESAIRGFAAAGHEVRLAVERDDQLGSRRLVERIIADHPAVSLIDAPVRGKENGADRLRELRLAIDYIRFRDPMYNRTPHLRARAEERAPEGIVRLLARPIIRRRPGRALVRSGLRWIERAWPLDARIVDWLGGEAPDVVLITPLIELGSQQFDYLYAAKSLGLRTALPVTSWDHLSSKALIRSAPDLILVWNEIQKDEAVRLHGVPADRVVVTGAQAYDHWFTWTPSRSRAEFCARVGLDPQRPFLLYVCSSLFKGTADETVFVDKWIRAVRASSDPQVRDAGILIRPHPSRVEEWAGFDFASYRDVAFWGSHPIDAETRDDYFQSLHYSAAVVGLNTSAFLEAAALGRPVHTVLLPKYSRNNQEGTIHFHYLLEVNGGVLHAARSLEEHVEQLRAPLTTHVAADPRSRRFTESFIRPYGLAVEAAPRFVRAIETLAASPRPRPQTAPLQRLARRLTPRVVKTLGKVRKPAPTIDGPASGARKRGEAVRARREAIGGVSALAPRVGKVREQKVLAGSETPEARATRELVVRLAESGRPIIVGPWLSEAGFELLYWIPFVAWAKRYGHLDPARLIVVSRGGTASWYQGITSQYEDVFSYFTPDEFRQRNEARVVDQKGVLKHVQLAGFDKEIVERVAAARGLASYDVLHPSAMYGLFSLFWKQHQPITLVELFTSYSLIAPSPLEPDIRSRLPERYVAAKFYGNVAMPDTPENHAFVTSALTALSDSVDVVLLNTGLTFDDHADLAAALRRGRLHSVEHLMTPADNLAVQTAIIRHAQAYVGTYGGFSYLAPMVGTDAVTFYSHPGGFRFDHLEVAKRVFSALDGGGFSEIDVRKLKALDAAFGGAASIAAALHAASR